jgi:hypothetical protein
MTLNDEERTKCEVWTRCMGYHRPVSAFNRGKQQEHLDRKKFSEGLCDAPHNDIYPEVLAPVVPQTSSPLLRNFINL